VATTLRPEGITNPPIDDLLDTAGSKYQLVIYAAKRARQINAYYSQLGEGLLEYVGPLVETQLQEKPLSIALREINSKLLKTEHVDPEVLAQEEIEMEQRRLAAIQALQFKLNKDITLATTIHLQEFTKILSMKLQKLLLKQAM